MNGGEGAEEVEHAADQSLQEGLRPQHLQLALQPQLFPGLLVRRTQVTGCHQIQTLVKTGLGRLETVGHNQDEAPATLALLWWHRQTFRYGAPEEVHCGTGATRELSSGRLSLDVSKEERKQTTYKICLVQQRKTIPLQVFSYQYLPPLYSGPGSKATSLLLGVNELTNLTVTGSSDITCRTNKISITIRLG